MELQHNKSVKFAILLLKTIIRPLIGALIIADVDFVETILIFATICQKLVIALGGWATRDLRPKLPNLSNDLSLEL